MGYVFVKQGERLLNRSPFTFNNVLDESLDTVTESEGVMNYLDDYAEYEEWFASNESYMVQENQLFGDANEDRNDSENATVFLVCVGLVMCIAMVVAIAIKRKRAK